MSISSANHPKTLWPAIKTLWGMLENSHKPEWSQIFDTVQSDKRYEEYVQEIGFDRFNELEDGAAITPDVTREGYTTRLTNITYGGSYLITLTEIEDCQYEKLKTQRTENFHRAYRLTQEKNAALILDRSDDSSYPGGDGKELLSSAHLYGTGGTFSNIINADLSHEAIEDLTIQIMGAKDPRGMEAAYMAQKLIVSRSDWYEANRIYGSVKQSGEFSNNTNVLKDLNIFPGGIVLNHYVEDQDAWYIKTDVPHGQGLIYQERIPMAIEKSNDTTTKNFVVTGRGRHRFGHVNPWGIAGSPGA
jgi:hypothetical protein